MALATTGDVRRILKRDDIPDEDITPFLETAEEWVERAYGRDWDATGSILESFYNQRQGAILWLKDDNPTVTEVKGFAAPGSTGSVLTEDEGFMVMDRGRILMAKVRQISVANLRPEEKEQLLPPFTWSRIEVTYTASGTVPAPVRDAVAIIAAAGFRQSAQEISGLSGERIGDYSYTRMPVSGAASGSVIPLRAKTLLAPYSRRRHAISV